MSSMSNFHDDPLDDFPEPEVPEVHTCQFVDLRTEEECGDDGTIFRVAQVDSVLIDAIEVCGKHLPAVMAEPRNAYRVWAVAIVQEVP